MRRDDQIVVVVRWATGVFLPSVVGPFPSLREANEWASGNAPAGHWQVEAMCTPERCALPRWTDLLGADPDYCDGMDVNEWLDKNRGEA